MDYFISFSIQLQLTKSN